MIASAASSSLQFVGVSSKMMWRSSVHSIFCLPVMAEYCRWALKPKLSFVEISKKRWGKGHYNVFIGCSDWSITVVCAMKITNRLLFDETLRPEFQTLGPCQKQGKRNPLSQNYFCKSAEIFAKLQILWSHAICSVHAVYAAARWIMKRFNVWWLLIALQHSFT